MQSDMITSLLWIQQHIIHNKSIPLVSVYDNNKIKGVKVMNNKGLKDYAKDKGVKLWQIAERLNLNDGNFSRKLRKELSEEEKQKIIEIINTVAKQKRGETL